jgi:hypothetical protein
MLRGRGRPDREYIDIEHSLDVLGALALLGAADV